MLARRAGTGVLNPGASDGGIGKVDGGRAVSRLESGSESKVPSVVLDGARRYIQLGWRSRALGPLAEGLATSRSEGGLESEVPSGVIDERAGTSSWGGEVALGPPGGGIGEVDGW